MSSEDLPEFIFHYCGVYIAIMVNQKYKPSIHVISYSEIRNHFVSIFVEALIRCALV